MVGDLVEKHRWFCYYAILVGPLLLVLCQKVLALWYNNNKSAVGIPPGNRGFPFVGETLQFMAAINSSKGVYEFVRVRRLRYGKCFKTKLFGETHVFFSSMESARAILNNEVGKFSKRYIKSIAELVGPHSLLSASHHHHKLIRGRLFPLFSTNSLSHFVESFDELVVQAMTDWQRGDFVIIQQEALKITCKAMCKLLIGTESGYELEMMQKEIGHVCQAMLAFPLKLTWTRFYKGLQARKRIMDILEKAISERRSGSASGHEDFLQRLLAENDNKYDEAKERRLTDKEIQDNILTMIIAGQDTTASAITWMVKFVDENQEVLDKLMKEQVEIAKKCTSWHLTLEDLDEMPYASKVAKEALRMASVVQWFPRVALEDCEIEGFKIKKGWNINIDARSIHLDPNMYNDPDVFNPSRFHPHSSKPYSFLAFGMGARTCLGKNMAKAMMLVFLQRLITTYKWKVIDSDSSIEKWALFSKLRSGCPVRLTSIKEEEDTKKAM